MGRRDGLPRRLRALLGAGTTVVVRGPAGIGKSTIVRRSLRASTFVLGQSLEPLADLPYHPLSHALTRPFAGPPAEVAADVAAELSGRTLVVEDAHWADAGTLDVLALIVGRVPLVVTSRSVLGLERDPAVALLEVPPLDDGAAADLAGKLHPHLDSASRSRLVELAGGNPLLLGQLVADDVVSPTLVDAVRSRVAALPSVTVEQLALVAVHRSPLPRPMLTAAGGAGVADAGTLVVEDDEGVMLAHALLADAIIGLVDSDTRRRLHRRLAVVCDDADAARHLAAAGDEKAAARARRTRRDDGFARPAGPAARPRRAGRGPTAEARLRLDAAAALIAVNQPSEAAAVVAGLADAGGVDPSGSGLVPVAGRLVDRGRGSR